jgi:hypothetical protein
MDATISRRILIEVDLAEGLELLNGSITRREWLRTQRHNAIIPALWDEAIAKNERAELALRAALEVPRDEDDLSLGDHFVYPS